MKVLADQTSAVVMLSWRRPLPAPIRIHDTSLGAASNPCGRPDGTGHSLAGSAIANPIQETPFQGDGKSSTSRVVGRSPGRWPAGRQDVWKLQLAAAAKCPGNDRHTAGHASGDAGCGDESHRKGTGRFAAASYTPPIIYLKRYMLSSPSFPRRGALFRAALFRPRPYRWAAGSTPQ